MKKNLRKIISVLLTLAMLIAVCPMLVSAEETQQEYKVVWIGGSFTEGYAGVNGDRSKCFATLVTNWMNETEWAGKNVNVTGINSGIGGTQSTYGRMRYEKDVLAYNPDLVFIEFNGNDAGMGNYLQAAYAMESMIRRTMTVSPETKIVILERPDWNAKGLLAEVKKYHKMVADRYDVAFCDITEYFPTDENLVSSDGTHPNEAGHAAIAAAIEDWLSKNVINYPTMTQFTVNPSYVPIIPAYHDAKDFMAAEETTGWYVNENGQLQSDTIGDILTLKIKGDAFAFPGAGGAGSTCTYVVDSCLIDDRESSRIKGYISYGGHCKGVMLGMGSGEHTITIKNNNQVGDTATAILDKIIVDSVENDNAAPEENALAFNVFEEKFDYSGFNWSTGSRYTNGNGYVSGESNYAHIIPSSSNSSGFACATSGASITYTLSDEASAVGSIWYRINSRNAYSDDNKIKVYAIDANGNETEINTLRGCLYGKDNNGAEVSDLGWYSYDVVGTGVPAGTKKIKLKFIQSGNYLVRLDNIRYTYGTPTFERVTMELNPRSFVGSEEQVVVKGYNSDGSEYDISDAEIVYYTSDNDIVDVNSVTGVVTGKAAGIATVNAEVTVGDKVFEKLSKIEVYDRTDVTSSSFSIPKNTYVVGTGGKIDFHAVINGSDTVDMLKTTYVSSNTDAVTIDNNGNFKAVGEGTAVITPSVTVLDVTYSPIIIKVIASNTRVHSFYDDNESGKFTITNMKNQYGQYIDCKTGSELYAWSMGGIDFRNIYLNANGMFNIGEGAGSGSGGNGKFAAFIYKLDDCSEKFEFDYTVNQYSVDPSIAYYSAEEFQYTLSNGTIVDFNNNDTLTTNKTYLAVYNGRTEDGAVELHDGWVKDTNCSKNVVSAADNEYVISSDIPDGAKYVLVLFDYASNKHPNHNAMKGAVITNKNEIAAVEPSGDNKLAVTFKGAEENPSVTSLKVNGTAAEAAVDSYDADTYTLYVSAPYTKGDTIDIEISGMTYQTITTDDREQISAVDLIADGVKVEAIPVGSSACSINSKVINTTEDAAYIIAAYYSADGKTLKDVKLQKVTPVGGEAEANLSFTFENGFDEGVIKVFCWKTSFAPFMNYNEIQTVFKAEDF